MTREWRVDAPRLAALGFVFIGLVWWSWLKWADLRVDTGEELFVPWRLSEGEVLYRDVAFLYGPLSKHLAAALFAVSGPSILTLVLVDLLLLAGFALFLERFLQQVADRWTATCGVLFFFGVFAFEQFVPTGNYNFVAPYRHEAVHGLMLAFVALGALFRWADTPTPGALRVVGLSLGGVLLTKPELVFAVLAAVAVGLGLLRFTVHSSSSLTPKALATLAGWTTILPVAFWLYFFARGMAPGEAAWSALGAFKPLLQAPSVTGGKFFAFSMGLDQVPRRVEELAWSVLGLGLVTALLVGLEWVLRRASNPVRWGLGALGAGLVATAVWNAPSGWDLAPRGLPVVCAIAALGATVHALRTRADWARSRGALQLAVLATFALALLGKMLLYTRTRHFGFYLAMPAALVLVVSWCSRVPRWLEARGFSGGAVFRLGATAVLAAFVGQGLRVSNDVYENKTLIVGESPDALVGFDPKRLDADLVVAQVLAHLEQHVPPEATLVALPEGSLFNYLSRRRSTVPYTIFTTTELTVYSEEVMLAALAANPPDVILWVRRSTAELGVGAFGVDPRYGAAIGRWVEAHYARGATFETRPQSPSRYGVDVLHRLKP